MFGNDYKNEIDKIKPDGFVKFKVKEKLLKGEKTPKKHKRMYISTIAAVLCVAIVVSVSVIGHKNVTPNIDDTNSMPEVVVSEPTETVSSESIPEPENITLMQTAESYDKILELINTKQNYVYSDGVYEPFGASPDSVKDSGNLATDVNGATSPNSEASANYSQTTTQVNGVDEADIIKTDGKYIYVLDIYADTLHIVDARGKKPKKIGYIKFEGSASELYLKDDKLIIIGLIHDDSMTKNTATIYDVSNPAKPKLIETCFQSGGYNTSRLIGDRVYLISTHYVATHNIDKNNAKTYVPYVSGKGYSGVLSPESIYLYDNSCGGRYTVISSFDINDGKMISSQAVLGICDKVYASTNNIIATSRTDNGDTQVARFKLDDDEIKNVAICTLEGRLLNQFSIDEYNGYFRFVLTKYPQVSYQMFDVEGTVSVIQNSSENSINVSSLVILDKNLNEVGKITDIAPDEQVYSVRFMGDMAYFVTFKQVDPLFSVDVSDPKNPKIIGALKIPGFSSYLAPYGDGKLLGIGSEVDENTNRTGNIKLSMFDINDPTNVTESDKIVLEDVIHSKALSNHKASLVDYDRNIISFSATTGWKKNNAGYSCLYVYAYENGKFVERLTKKYEYATASIIRPLYIGDVFYIITEDDICYYDINTFEKLGGIYIKYD